MFIGSINSKIGNLIFTEKKLFSEGNICVGCSGNFTVEQILQRLGCRIWPNYIALYYYSSLIGNHLAGKPMRLEIADPAYSWLEPYVAPGGGLSPVRDAQAGEGEQPPTGPALPSLS